MSDPPGVGAPDVTLGSRPRAPLRTKRWTPGGTTIVAAVLALLAIFVGRQDYLFDLTTACSYAIAATGLGVALGLAGEYLLVQGAIFAVGAYVGGVLGATYGWTFLLTLVAGGVAGLVVGLVFSLLGLRVSRFYFAMIGFFLVFLTPDVIQIFSSQTGGSVGLSVAYTQTVLGLNLSRRGLFIVAAITLVIALGLVQQVRASPLGVQMRRLRDAPVAVAVGGTSVWRVRLLVYVTACTLAGVGGALYAPNIQYLEPSLFDLSLAILLFAAVLVGGQTSLVGPTVGIAVLFVLPTLFIDIQGYYDIVYGATVLVAIMVLQGGAATKARRWVNRRAAGLRRERGIGPKPVRASSAVSRRARPVVVAPRPMLADPTSVVDLLMEIRRNLSPAKLAATGVGRSFGGVRAVAFEPDDHLAVCPGEVHLLLGPNGSGKTSLLNLLTGVIRPDLGAIRLGEHDITRAGAAAVARHGVARSFQTPVLPPELTPCELLSARLSMNENVALPHWLLADPTARRCRARSEAKANQLGDAFGIGEHFLAPCRSLTSGQRRMVDVLYALTCPANVIILDEPAAGLSSTERRRLAQTITGLAQCGVGLLVVEHDLDLAMGIADTVTVMAEGRVIAQGPPSEIRHSPAVRLALIGEKEQAL